MTRTATPRRLNRSLRDDHAAETRPARSLAAHPPLMRARLATDPALAAFRGAADAVRPSSPRASPISRTEAGSGVFARDADQDVLWFGVDVA